MTKTLSQLLPSIKNTVTSADGVQILDLQEINKIPISNLVFDSRDVSENSLFLLYLELTLTAIILLLKR